MSDEYEFKTNFDKFWEERELHDRKEGRSKCAIKKDHNFFLNGFEGDPERLRIEQNHTYNLSLYPMRTIRGWEEYFSYFGKCPLSSIQVRNFEGGVLRGVSPRFHAEDKAYYIRKLWAEVWEPNSVIHIIIPSEEAILPTNPHMIISSALGSARDWLYTNSFDDDTTGYLRYIPDFINRIPEFIDLRVYDAEKYHRSIVIADDVQIPVKVLKSLLQKIIAYAHKSKCDDENINKRIDFAQHIFEIFNSKKDQLGDFPLLVEKTLEEAEE